MHMKTLEGYNRDLDALQAEGLNEETDKRFEELKGNIKMVGEEINRLFSVLGDDVGPVDHTLGFGGGAKRKRNKKKRTKRKRKRKGRKTKKKRRRTRKK